jgi:oligogalacturonide lyase
VIKRRAFLAGGLAAACLRAESQKGAAFPAAWKKYSDATTDFDVFRLTDPEYSSTMPAAYNRAISRNSSWMLFCGERGDGAQAYRIDLKNGEGKQLTQIEGLDGGSLTLTPDNRSFGFFAGRSLYISNLAALRERELYKLPEGWERSPGMSVGPDGTHATFAERSGEKSRIRMAPLLQGPARTVVEAPFPIYDPIHRPMRAQILYRQGDRGLWLVNSDGQQNHQLKTAPGRIGTVNWSHDGKTVLYLNYPDDATQLRAIRELTPDTNTDKLLAKTSQFAAFGFNRDSSVFVGSSSNAASPTVLLLLRITKRELTLCEHKASHPEQTCPIFSPDSQRIYFQSDREGKSALYCVHVDKLVEKTEVEGG